MDRAQLREDPPPHGQRERVARVLPAEGRQWLRARFDEPPLGTRVLCQLRGQRPLSPGRALRHGLGLLEHEMRGHRLGPERAALMQDAFVDQHEGDGLGIGLPIRAHEDAELVEDLDEQPRARAVHADDDERARLSQPCVHQHGGQATSQNASVKRGNSKNEFCG
jgi:hypothetical protein